MKRVDDLLKYLEGYSDIAVVNKAKIHQELLLIKKELAAINYTHCCTEFFCEDMDLEYSSKKCKKQCSGCKWIENL